MRILVLGFSSLLLLYATAAPVDEAVEGAAEGIEDELGYDDAQRLQRAVSEMEPRPKQKMSEVPKAPHCPAGYYSEVCFPCEGGVMNYTCTPCPPGFYKPKAGKKLCARCGGLQGTVKEGSALCTTLCKTGEYLITDGPGKTRVCQLCPIGQFKSSRSLDRSCDLCPIGMTTSGPGSKDEEDCIPPTPTEPTSPALPDRGCYSNDDCSDLNALCDMQGGTQKCRCPSNQYVEPETNVCSRVVSPGYSCYSFTYDEVMMRQQGYSEREVCEYESGRIFTADYDDELFPDCEGCWCCKASTTIDTTPPPPPPPELPDRDCHSNDDCSDLNALCDMQGGTQKCRCPSNQYVEPETNVCSRVVSPGYACYSFTYDETMMRPDGYSEREVCEHESGRIFTADYDDELFPDCEGCWCCKASTSIDTTPPPPPPPELPDRDCYSNDDCSDLNALCDMQGGAQKCRCPSNQYVEPETNVCSRVVSPGYLCYSFTYDEVMMRQGGYSEREVCEYESGRIFTADYDEELFPDCIGCWCCKASTTIDTTPPPPPPPELPDRDCYSNDDCSDLNALCDMQGGTQTCRCPSNQIVEPETNVCSRVVSPGYSCYSFTYDEVMMRQGKSEREVCEYESDRIFTAAYDEELFPDCIGCWCCKASTIPTTTPPPPPLPTQPTPPPELPDKSCYSNNDCSELNALCDMQGGTQKCVCARNQFVEPETNVCSRVPSPGYFCYSYTYEESMLRSNHGYSERQVCENGPGRVFTAGYDTELYPDCPRCWCCKAE